ncbi:MAG: CHAT domain-containing protein [Vulcanimicrobiota bacterium]
MLGFGPALADDLSKAREALYRGRGDQALLHLTGSSVPARVLRLQAYCELEEYTQARELLTELEKEKHGSFPPPFDFQFYLSRGQVEQAGHHDELALKNYDEAYRRAADTDQKVQAVIRRTGLWIAREQLEKAGQDFDKLRSLLPEVEDRAVVAKVLELSARLQYHSGNRTGAMVDNRAARELYSSLEHTGRAAGLRSQGLFYSALERDESYKLKSTESVINELLAVGDYPRMIEQLQRLVNLYFQLASTPEGKRILSLLERLEKTLPPGRYRSKAQRSRIGIELESDRVTAESLALLRRFTATGDREIRCLAHQSLARYHSEKGDLEGALEELRKALELATPQMKGDPDWQTAPGPVLLQMSYQEKARHNNPEALRFAHRGIELQTGPDWALWRATARYDTLMAAMASFDRRLVAQELAAGLLEIRRLPNVGSRVTTLTTLLSSLLINQSVESDVLDPAELLLGEYPESTRTLLRTVFEKHGGVDIYLAEFDLWQQQMIRKGEADFEAYPLIYKGLLLEALGRTEEAEGALRSARGFADRQGAKVGRMLSRVLLARVLLTNGNQDLAMDYLAEAAEVAESLNPLTGRFYLLVSGSAQRRYGRLEQSLLTFERAVRLNPEKGWPGHYGRALALEELGRLEEALEELEQAAELLGSSERAHSIAEVKAAQARILVTLSRTEQALGLYAEAYRSLTYSVALPRVTLEYGTLLERLGESEKAFEVYRTTLDQFTESSVRLDAEMKSLFERAVTVALQLGRQQQALHYLHLSRSAELLESVDVSRVAADDQQTRDLLEEIEALRERLTHLREESGRIADATFRDSIGQQVTTTRSEFFSKLHQLREREPDFEALVQVTGSQLAAIQELLPPDVALLEYFPAQSALYVFVVSSESFSIHQVSLSRSVLSRMSERLTSLCADPDSSSEEIEELSRTLYDALIGVAREQLVGRQSLRLIPSGVIWEIPFGVLRGADGTTLAQQYELSYLGTSELLKILGRRGRPASLTPALLVQGTDELKGTIREVRELAAELQDVTVLSDGNVNGEAFREAVKGKQLLHIASHSVVSRDTGQSFVQLGEDEFGLEEIYGLELEASSLVVLSSCRSGVGVVVPGKEVTSLATAFSVAGASAVVASRWRVDDDSTSRFFAYFYQALARGESRGDALRFSQAKMAKEKPHPYYWAAFSLLGDPR